MEWFPLLIRDSIASFKLELYDKFMILNFRPNYDSVSMVYIFALVLEQAIEEDFKHLFGAKNIEKYV